MAGDWIKMRVGLTTNPKVMRIAEHLVDDKRFLDWAALSYGVGSFPSPSESEEAQERHAALRVTRYVTVTALLRFWGYANEHIKDDFLAGVFPADVDEIVGVPGFSDALCASEWGTFDLRNGGMTLPNFQEHNTSFSARTSGAERQKRYRDRKRGFNGYSVTSRVTGREEKRRSTTPVSPSDQKPEASSGGNGAKRTRRRLPATPCPDEFEVTDKMAQYAVAMGLPAERVMPETTKFLDHYRADGKLWHDWHAAWRKWIGKAVEFGARK